MKTLIIRPLEDGKHRITRAYIGNINIPDDKMSNYHAGDFRSLYIHMEKLLMEYRQWGECLEVEVDGITMLPDAHAYNQVWHVNPDMMQWIWAEIQKLNWIPLLP